MVLGFIIWSSVGLIAVIIGIISWTSKNPVGFFAGVKPPEVDDVKKYNHSCGLLWFVYALFFELLGLPLLFLEQNSAGFVIPLLGTVFITIGLIVIYMRIVSKHQKKN